MVGCVDGVPRDAVASRDASDPPADARRARHEATGEWPQPTPVDPARPRRAQADPDRPYLIEGLREGGRTLHASRRRAARRSHRGRARPSRRRAGRRGLVAAAELDRGRGAGGGDRSPRRGLEPDHHDLPRARGRLRLPPGAARACWSCPAWCAASITASWRARCGQRRRDSSTSSPCAPTRRRGSARSSRSRTIPARRCRRRRTARTTWRRSSTPPGRPPTRRACCTRRRRSAPSCTTTRSSSRRRPTIVSLLQFPLTHIGGIVMFVMLPLRSGSSVVLHGGLRSRAGGRPDRAPRRDQRRRPAGDPAGHVRGARTSRPRRCAPCAAAARAPPTCRPS